MVVWQLIGRGLIALFYAAPWVWLLCFGAFTIGVAYVTGHFPPTAIPDPKRIDDLSMLYTLVVMWFGLALLSPFVVAVHALARVLIWPASPPEGMRLIAYAIGAALVAYVILGDPAGLRTWLWD
jgi:hypothetical protein